LRLALAIVVIRSDFKAKMHPCRFRLGLCPRSRWRSLQRSSPTPHSWI